MSWNCLCTRRILASVLGIVLILYSSMISPKKRFTFINSNPGKPCYQANNTKWYQLFGRLSSPQSRFLGELVSKEDFVTIPEPGWIPKTNMILNYCFSGRGGGGYWVDKKLKIFYFEIMSKYCVEISKYLVKSPNIFKSVQISFKNVLICWPSPQTRCASNQYKPMLMCRGRLRGNYIYNCWKKYHLRWR